MIRVAHRFGRHFGAAAILVSLALVNSSVFARQSAALDRLNLSLGGYYASVDTTIGASTTNGEYRGNVNLEDDLGFRRRNRVPRARLDLLIGDSQGFSFDYFSVNRAHGQVLGHAFNHGRSNYAATATIHGKLDFDFGSAAYRWWFGHGNNVSGLGLGGAWYRVRMRIRGSATVNGVPAGATAAGTGARAWAPELQLGWRHAFNRQWRMYADASGVKNNGGRLYGHIYHAGLGVESYPWRSFGFGAEYGYTQIKLDQRRHIYDDSLHMQLKGPSLFVKFRL